MGSKINQILKEIEAKKIELKEEYENLKKRYNFSFSRGRVIFTKQESDYNKKFRKGVCNYLLSLKVRHLLSLPFIYSMIIPVLILDIFLIIYQHSAFRLYGIPLVKRSDYITYDRQHLDYLNVIQKVNCIYCAYVNGIFSYAVEIGGRTEKYWCPIKYAKKMKTFHNWQSSFSDYGDAEGFQKVFINNEEFYKKDR